jgi:hypothetical protein
MKWESEANRHIYIDIEGADAGRYLVGVSWVAGLTTRGRLVAVEDPEMASVVLKLEDPAA